MNLNQKQVEALLRIFEYERTHNPKDFSLGWSWTNVRAAPATLNNLLLKGLIEEKFHSNSYRGLLLTELGREQAKQLVEPIEVDEKPQNRTLTLPDDIFEDITGHDEVKELLTSCASCRKACARIACGTTGTCQVLIPLGYRASRRRGSSMARRLGNKQGRAMGLSSRTRATDFAYR